MAEIAMIGAGSLVFAKTPVALANRFGKLTEVKA